MNLQNPKIKSIQLDLSTLLSVKLIPDLFTGKKLSMDFQYLYLTESLLALTYNCVTHPRWNMSKDSKLWMREIKCIHNIISLPPLPNAYIQPGVEKTHPTCFLLFCALGSRRLHLLADSTLLS